MGHVGLQAKHATDSNMMVLVFILVGVSTHSGGSICHSSQGRRTEGPLVGQERSLEKRVFMARLLRHWSRGRFPHALG